MAYQTFLDNGQTHLPYLMSASLIQVVPGALKPDDFNARQLLHLPISFGNGHNEVDGPVRQICCRYTTKGLFTQKNPRTLPKNIRKKNKKIKGFF